jgi:hypothetical protein
MSTAQIVMIGTVVCTVCYLILRFVYVSETRRVKAAELQAPLVRAAQQSDVEPARYSALPPSLETLPTLRGEPLTETQAPVDARRDLAADPSDLTRQSQQHYLSGMVYYAHGDYDLAKREWESAVKADPQNADAQTALKRVKQVLGSE